MKVSEDFFFASREENQATVEMKSEKFLALPIFNE